MKEIPVLVLLPGLDGTGDLFAPFTEVLPENIDSKVLSYQSDGPADYPGLASALFSRLPDKPFVLIGESFGGPLALYIARLAPENLVAIVMCGSFVLSPQPGIRKGRLFERLLRLLYHIAPMKAVVRNLLLDRVVSKNRVDATLRAINRAGPDVLLKRMHSIISLDARDMMRTCHAPLLIISGNKDKLVGDAATSIIKECRPDAVYAKIDAPHGMLQTHPGQVWDIIDRFLHNPDISQA